MANATLLQTSRGEKSSGGSCSSVRLLHGASRAAYYAHTEDCRVAGVVPRPKIRISTVANRRGS